MAINNSQRAGFASELSAAMTGSSVLIGKITNSPTIMIFDNQGTASVAISIDNFVTTWRTFPAGEALVLDLRGNHGIAPNFTIDVGTNFYGNGASGTFSISYLYAINS